MHAVRLMLFVGCVLATLAGCTPVAPKFFRRHVDLEPPKQPEVLATPPLADRRYDSPNYPKEAFNTYDPLRRRDMENAIMPTRGMGMGPGGTGMMPTAGARGPYQ